MEMESAPEQSPLQAEVGSPVEGRELCSEWTGREGDPDLALQAA